MVTLKNFSSNMTTYAGPPISQLELLKGPYLALAQAFWWFDPLNSPLAIYKSLVGGQNKAKLGALAL